MKNLNNETDQISFFDISLIIIKNLKIIIITPFIICCLSIAYVLFIVNPMYTSVSKIMSSSNQSSIGSASGIAAQFGFSFSNNDGEMKWVYPEIIKSRTLAKKLLIRRFDTIEYGLDKSLFEIITMKEKSKIINKKTLEFIAINKVLKMISVSENSKTNINTIKVISTEPKFSQRLNEVLLEELTSYQHDYNRNKTGKTRIFIQERINKIENELMKSEETLKNFKDRNRRIENSPTLQLEQQRLQRETQVLTSVFTTLKQELETVKIEEVKDADDIYILDEPDYPIYPSKPKKKDFVIIMSFIGFIIGIFIALILELISKKKNKALIKKLKIELRKVFTGYR